MVNDFLSSPILLYSISVSCQHCLPMLTSEIYIGHGSLIKKWGESSGI